MPSATTRRGVGAAVVFLFMASVLEPAALAGPARRSLAHPAVARSTRHDLSPPLRLLAAEGRPPARARAFPARPLPREPVAVEARGRATAVDPAMQRELDGSTIPAPIQSFEGVNNVDDVLPPDTNGDVGPTHYVQWVNLHFAVFDKATGATLLGPAPGNSLWAGFGGPCETRNDGDPIVLYDQLADRWFMSQFALPFFPFGPFYQCVAVSQTGDPTGAFHRYEFEISATKLNDYPKFGVWPDGYYMSINQFNQGTLTWGGAGAVAFERDKMLAGLPAQMVYFDLFSVDSTLGGMLPSDLDGPTPPPAGAPNYFLQMDDNAPADQLRLFRFHVDWANPAASSFTGPATLPAASFDSNLCNFTLNCIPQPGTFRRLDAISDRLMFRLAYRNFGDHESLVANHTVDVNDAPNHAGIRWYEIRDPGGAPVIFQQGTYSPDSTHRWMGSIAMDGSGNIAVGFSASSTSVFPSIRYAGRLATDPLGTLPQGEGTLIAGGGSQTSSSSRWGDYSMLAVDPVDDCTFWYTNEYYPSTHQFEWQTRIGSFKFDTCGSPPGPGLSIDDVTVVEGNAGTVDAAFTVTLAPASSQSVTVDFTTEPGTATEGIDYQDTTGTLTLAAGQTTGTITVLVNGDTDAEPDETLFVNLSNAVNATIADDQGQGTIANDDEAPGATVTVTDTGYSPRTVTIDQGQSVLWTNDGPGDNTATDASGMGLFDSGILSPGATYAFTFIAAANHRYKNTLHPTVTGTVRVRLRVSPASGGTSTVFTVTWASADIPAPFVADVQIKRPGSTGFVNWMRDQTGTSATFLPDAGTGTYQFRARLRNTANGKAAAWSLAASITVT